MLENVCVCMWVFTNILNASLGALWCWFWTSKPFLSAAFIEHDLKCSKFSVFSAVFNAHTHAHTNTTMNILCTYKCAKFIANIRGKSLSHWGCVCCVRDCTAACGLKWCSCCCFLLTIISTWTDNFSSFTQLMTPKGASTLEQLSQQRLSLK